VAGEERPGPGNEVLLPSPNTQMTAIELIAELQKYPPGTGIMVHSTYNPENPAPLASIVLVSYGCQPGQDYLLLAP
jgi:hypothetical protein